MGNFFPFTNTLPDDVERAVLTSNLDSQQFKMRETEQRG
ncbi:hypothetical protein MTo_03183 [Microcystis aeruginosa NIES-1211]|uniref:Uncharacterized protein n=1 Tax=Microcystis aeruginosa NIES-2519 TaxID=2303981 RepID=A0A5A5R516_MICAE|nr:hypothetical protein MTo_03183 [Microcystis aeruginosa NIES-1211]GCA69779.1 hypothetical protein MiYa_01309 [Microcystis aeruginosa NIES-2519]GCA85188.1 hypothetical protein MiHa_03167 [Microcystis aeruginosa NIES-2522]GCA89715.1 hypothetical protein MiTa_03067 [Microcystis aeruginosa NIES-4264]CCI30869.1 hypothetical protein MICAI_1470012 [Microcystis sp. T1-4]